MRGRIIRLILLMVLVQACGCASMLKPEDSKAQADLRWRKVRAQLKYQLALENYEKGRLEEAEDTLREVVGLYPDFTDAFVLLTRLRLEKGETAAASEALDEAMRCGGDSSETDYLSGMIAQRYERFDVALEWYRRALERKPNDVQYVLAVAEMLVALDRSAEALELARARWPDFDNNAAIRALAGKIYMILSDYEAAVEAFRSAYRVDPRDNVVAGDLGLAMVYAGHYTEARDIFLEIENRKGQLPRLLRMELARCFMELEDSQAARAEFRKIVESDPHYVSGWKGLAEAALETRDLMSARIAAGKCYELAPGDGQYALLYGYVCYRQQDDKEAVSALRVAVRLLRDDPVAHCLLGQCLQRLGRSEEARSCYQRAIAVQPDNPWARQLLDDLSEEAARAPT